MTAAEIQAILRLRHPPDKWVYLEEVRTKTGYSGSGERYLDGFAMHLWPSQGYRRIGYEIKVSRSDWLAELKDPVKRQTGIWLTHELYFVVAPQVLAPDNDPDPSAVLKRRWCPDFQNFPLHGAGVLEVQPDGTLKNRFAAERRQAWPMPEHFIASLLRQIQHIEGRPLIRTFNMFEQTDNATRPR